MDVDRLTQQLADNADRIRVLAQDVSPDQARWRPNAASWSILDVVCHLHDEEREDFRMRLDIILHGPDQPWPRIDPRGWVLERQYDRQELVQSLAGFLRERRASLTWLRDLSAPDWEQAYQAPFGTIRAGDMFAAWIAHDLLHLRQLVELHFAYTVQQVQPYETRYAGDW
jgi:hypothetical protein